MDRIRVAIVGATGYTGSELLRLLLGHPGVTVTALYARDRLVSDVSTVLPALTGLCKLPVEAFDPDAVARAASVVFSALPHGASATVVRALHARGLRVFDLSADFRLRDPDVYARWYGLAHPCPELLSTAVYGLAELTRDTLPGASLVAVPGCYPTASVLPLLPLLSERWVSPEDIVIHALSGVSGAGRTPGASTHYAETAEGARPYKIAGTHRHTPEIEQCLSGVAGRPVTVTFTPTLVPFVRGMLATVYLRPARREITVQALTDAARTYFQASPAVAVLDPGVLPDTLWVRGSNRAHVGYAVDSRTDRVIALCAIDNLVKGASGQAVQCMNLSLGFDEALGLRAPAVFP